MFFCFNENPSNTINCPGGTLTNSKESNRNIYQKSATALATVLITMKAPSRSVSTIADILG
jgi:hypothetical protein